MTTLRALLVLTVAITLWQACKNKTRQEEVKEEYREAGHATREYFEHERDSAVRSMEEQKARIDARLETTRENARKAKGDAKRKADEQAAKLERLSKRAGDRIEEARASSREKWEQAKLNIRKAADDIEAEWDTLVNKLDQP